MNYHVKRKAGTRFTFRTLGIVLILVGGTQIAFAAAGAAGRHIIGTVFCFLFFLYGIWLTIHSYSFSLYSADYSFEEKGFRVTAGRRKKEHSYKDVTTLDLVTPEDPELYSLIHLRAGKDDFVIPFTCKKKVCDQIYAYLNQRVAEALTESPAGDGNQT